MSAYLDELIVSIQTFSVLGLYTLSALLPLLGTPIRIPVHQSFISQHNKDTIYRQIVTNLAKDSDKLSVLLWVQLFRLLINAGEAHSEVESNVRLSLLLTASRFGIQKLKGMSTILLACEIVDDNAPIAAPILRLFEWQACIDAFREFHHSPHYVLPPTIVHVRCAPTVRGWVCGNNIIAINIERTASVPADSACQLLDTFTLIAHESKHGDLRTDLSDLNAHTSDALQQQYAEAGRLVELSMWSGIWPQWYSPNYTEEAEFFAEQLLASVEDDLEFRLSEDDVDKLKSYVGDRYNAQGMGGVDIAELEVYD